MNGRVINTESFGLMTTPARLNNDSATTYGYGLNITTLEGHRMLQHGGGINGFVSQLAHFPDDRLTVVVLSNTEGVPVSRTGHDIARIALGVDLHQ